LQKILRKLSQTDNLEQLIADIIEIHGKTVLGQNDIFVTPNQAMCRRLVESMVEPDSLEGGVGVGAWRRSA